MLPPGRPRVPGGWPAVVAVVALGAVVVAPLAELARVAVGAGSAAVVDAVARGGVATAALHTLWTSLAVTPLAVAAGTAAALVTERAAVPGRRWLRAGMLLALFVPSFVAAQSWARAYGPSGLTDDLVGVALPGVYGPFGVVAVMTVHAVPLAYLVVVGGLAARVEPDADRAARVSGATPWQTVRGVTLPLLRPALTAAGVLVFVTAVNAFGIPATLGLPADFPTLTTRIYRDLAFAADPVAFTRVVVLAVGLVLVAVVAVGVGDLRGALRASATRTGAPAGHGAAAAGSVTPASRLAAAGLWCWIVVTSVVPLAALVLTALSRAVGLPPRPGNWTLDNFAEALSGPTRDALGNSLLLAVAAATLVVLLGGLLAGLGMRRSGRALGTAATLTFAVPGSALAVAVLLAYGGWLRDSLLLILVAYLAKFWALGHRTIAGSVEGLPPDLRRAARVSGAGPWRTLVTVTVPLLRPALVGAWLVVFVISVQELTMSALLYGPGSATLAVVVLNAQQLGDLPVTAAMAVLLTGVVLLAAAPLLHRGWGRR